MDQEKMNIQWYPGHMTKTRRQIEADLKQVDAVCEIVDARIPFPAGIRILTAFVAASPESLCLTEWILRILPPQSAGQLISGGKVCRLFPQTANPDGASPILIPQQEQHVLKSCSGIRLVA